MRRLALLLVLLVSCGDSGSRSSSPPQGEKIGPWAVEWWPNAKLQEQEWLRETVREHAALIQQLPNGQKGLDPTLAIQGCRIVFHGLQQEIDQGHADASRLYKTQLPAMFNTLGARIGYWDTFTGTIHIWPGYRLEGDGLTQMILRWEYQDFAPAAASNSLAYWQAVQREDFLLAFSLYQQR